MLSTARIARDHHAAGRLHAQIAVCGFVDDHSFITKAGDIGVVYRLAGVDFECLDEPTRDGVVHQMATALRVLDEHVRLYQYLVRRRIRPLPTPPATDSGASDAIRRHRDYLNNRRDSLFDVSLYLVLVDEHLRRGERSRTRLGELWRAPRQRLRAWFDTSQYCALLETDLERALSRLHQKAGAFAAHLRDMRPERLHKRDVFGFLRSLVNYDSETAMATRLVYDTHVDYFMADSVVECHRDHLDVDGLEVRVLTMKEPPSSTFPLILRDLYSLPGEFVACLEWQRIPADRMRRDIRVRRRHFFNRRIALVNYVSPQTRPEDMLVDESAGAVVRQLGEALTDLDVHGHFFGECSLTLVIPGEDAGAVRRTAGQALKIMGTHDGAFMEERYNLLNAWLAVLPGNSAHNLRRLALLETHCADLSFLFTLDEGQPTCPHLAREALTVFETPHQAPYHFTLHVRDVGHTLLLGTTGSGKSFLLTFLLMQAQRYDPLTVVFDLARGYRTLASTLQGSYVELGLRQRDVTINPFALEPTPEHLHFLHAFVRVLVDSADAYQLSHVEDRELYEAIQNLYVLDADQRRLSTLANLLPRALAGRLTRWVGAGRYGSLFDNAEDTVSIRPCQVFDLHAMQTYPELLEPLLFYVLHRVTLQLHHPDRAGRLTLCALDEAWRFIQHPRLRAYVHEALKTWRKYNAAMLLATQAIDDFASQDLLRTVVESCPTKLLLANPAVDRATYQSLFQLNDRELACLAGLIPRQEFLMKRPDVSKVLTLQVDAASHRLYSNVC